MHEAFLEAGSLWIAIRTSSQMLRGADGAALERTHQERQVALHQGDASTHITKHGHSIGKIVDRYRNTLVSAYWEMSLCSLQCQRLDHIFRNSTEQRET